MARVSATTFSGYFRVPTSTLADLHEVADFLSQIMVKRRQQVGFRLAMMALMVAFFWRYLSIEAMLGWALVYSALQAFEYFALATSGLAATANGRRLALTTIALNSLVFGLPAVLWARYGGALGLSCGAYLLSGAVLNTVLTTRGCKSALLASIGPFIFYVISSAFIAGGAHLKWDAIGTMGIAGAMMSLSAISLWTDATKTQRSEAAALASLNDREAQLELALQQAEEASQAKSAFLANMSHELRTPLNGILGMASVLARTKLVESQRDIVDVISVSAKNLQSLLTDVLDLAKIEAAQIDLQADPIAPASVLRSVGSLFAATCTEKGLSLDLDVDDQSESGVLADGLRLVQIITNFCSNAIKFTERGGVKLCVRTTTQGARSTVVFTVSDTGIGMSAEGKARLFERFVQADGSITRRFGGTGLGLSISKSLTDLMGGEIEVASEEGKGSTFTVTLNFPSVDMPIVPKDDSEPGHPSAIGESQTPLRVLLVEDHPVNRQVVQLILADFASVEVAVNGAEGVDAAKARDFDVILMDMQMPVMDGVTATQQIRAWETEQLLPRTPIVMLTANAMKEHIEQSLEAGADIHLAKPITAESLLMALDEVFDKIEPGAFIPNERFSQA
jgi:signal transduction histidine kinase/CheY-like chemotaxis protein